jgi:hypothetical protein
MTSEFFEQPVVAVAPEPPRYRMPPWVRSPEGTLPGIVPLELVLARTDKVAVCVAQIAAYPAGFELELTTMASDDARECDPMLFGPHHHRGPRRPGADIPREMLRFGVQFADGSKATNTGARFRGPHDNPAGPVMHPGGGGGGGASWRQTLWVWPLPPPGLLALVCEWPAAGIEVTRHELDAQLVLDAAKRAAVIFSDEHLPDPPGRDRQPGSASTQWST